MPQPGMERGVGGKNGVSLGSRVPREGAATGLAGFSAGGEGRTQMKGESVKPAGTFLSRRFLTGGIVFQRPRIGLQETSLPP